METLIPKSGLVLITRVRVSRSRTYLAGRGLREGEVDLRLDGEADVVRIKGSLSGMLGIGLGVTKHVDNVAVHELKELENNPTLILTLSDPHRA